VIAAGIPGPSPSEAAAQVEAARRAGADLVELRLDLFDRPDPGPFLESKSLPVIATLRPAWEGGGWTGNEDDRIAILRDAARGGADWIDLEFKAYKDFDRGNARLILSWHEASGMPSDLDARIRKMSVLEPDLLKLAAAARGTADVLAAVRAQRALDRAGVVIPMGDWGEAARILTPRLGGAITYAAVERGKETAPGQLTVGDLAHDYRVKSIDDETQIYAVFGDPVAHSQSPRLFNRVFHVLGLNARYVKVRLDSAALLREAMNVLGIRGGSVTIPHKVAALAQVEEPDERVRAIGAVNTVVLREGRLHGHSTDAPGAVETIQAAAMRKWKHGVYGLRALVLGAGGAARAVAWAEGGGGARDDREPHVREGARAGPGARLRLPADGPADRGAAPGRRERDERGDGRDAVAVSARVVEGGPGRVRRGVHAAEDAVPGGGAGGGRDGRGRRGDVFTAGPASAELLRRPGDTDGGR
jgi:3-dehydroquinate dehydratase/shikimate dehydrogenase